MRLTGFGGATAGVAALKCSIRADFVQRAMLVEWWCLSFKEQAGWSCATYPAQTINLWAKRMNHATWISLISLAIAFFALVSTALQAGRIARLTKNSHQIQVIADVFREVRSAEFLDHYRRVLSLSQAEDLGRGIEALDIELRTSIYAVAYFFEHLGVLVTRQLISGDALIATMRTLIVRSWEALEPAIEAELRIRQLECPEHAGRAFLPHFRALAAMAGSHAGKSHAGQQGFAPGAVALTEPQTVTATPPTALPS